MARDELPPLPDYLIPILMSSPHNLTLQMAKRFSKAPQELSYYNSVMEMGESDGQLVCNWYIPQNGLFVLSKSLVLRELSNFSGLFIN